MIDVKFAGVSPNAWVSCKDTQTRRARCELERWDPTATPEKRQACEQVVVQRLHRSGEYRHQRRRLCAERRRTRVVDLRAVPQHAEGECGVGEEPLAGETGHLADVRDALEECANGRGPQLV